MLSKADKELALEIKRTRTRLAQAEQAVVGRPGYIYLIRQCISENAYDCPYKIGQSIDPEKRLEQLQRSEPYVLEIVTTFETDNVGLAEYRLHYHFEEGRIRGEWFVLDRHALEWFANVRCFWRGMYRMYTDYTTLPQGFWNGSLDLPF